MYQFGRSILSLGIFILLSCLASAYSETGNHQIDRAEHQAVAVDELKLVDRFDTKRSARITMFALLTATLGKHSPAKMLQKASFTVTDSLAEYEDQAEKAFSGFEDAVVMNFSPSQNVIIPLGYLPPKDGKPVLIHSLGALTYLSGYREFVTALHQKGYGVLAYQYSLLEPNGRHISDSGISFADMETLFRENLNQVSMALEKGQFKRTNGEIVTVLKVPFNRQVLMGYSTGGINATEVMVAHPERAYPALLLFAAPPTFEKAFQNIIKGECYRFVYWILPKKRMGTPFAGVWELEKILSKVQRPLLYVEGTHDAVVRNGGEQLYAAFERSKTNPTIPSQFAYVANADHNNIVYSEHDKNYGRPVADMIDRFLTELKLGNGF